MGQRPRAPALAMVAILVLATVLAEEPARPLDVALAAEGQTADPVSPAKLEASGESDLSTSAQRLGTGLAAVTLAGAPGSDSSGLDPLSSGSSSAAEAQGGPILDGPARSEESEEGEEGL